MKKSWIILIAIIILGIIFISILAFNQRMQNPSKSCHAVWEGKYVEGKDFQEGISAHMNYEGYCPVFKTREECENSIDIVNYSIARDSFNEAGDNLPDCEWR